jgi:prepilin-type processing-associated H-X9-DG protein
MYLSNFEEYFPLAWHEPEGTDDLDEFTYHRFLIHEQCDSNFTVNNLTDAEEKKDTVRENQLFWEDPGKGLTPDYFGPTLVFKIPVNSSGAESVAEEEYRNHAQYNEVVKDVPSTERPMLTGTIASTPDPEGPEGTETVDGLNDDGVDHFKADVGGTGITLFYGVGDSTTDTDNPDVENERFDFRHNGSMNVLFLDGHVDTVKQENRSRVNRIHNRWNNLIPEDDE